MKKFNGNPICAILVFCFVLVVLGLTGPNAALAATSPSLGAAATYGLLSTTYVDPVTPLQSTINGDVGFTIAPAQVPLGVQTNYGALAPYATAGIDQGTALTALNIQACTAIAGALDAVIIGANPPGVFPPGCYSMVGAMNITLGTSVTLDLTAPGGVGNTWIFRSTGALNTGADSFITLANGASACNVFWAPVGATTIGAYTGPLPNTTKLFIGTIIDDAGISLGANSNLLGNALAFASTVTLGDNTTINVPVCVVPPVPGGSTIWTGTVNVVKTVVGGTKMVADFPLFINGNLVTSGVTNVFTINNTTLYNISETVDPNYIQTFSGDCDSNGDLYLMTGGNRFCVITNTFRIVPVVVPPIISVVKVPSPLSLPAGPGPVNYTYTARNIGTVPINNVTMIGDSCSPITMTSGDTNSNGILDLTETWIYNCSTTLTETHTNTVTVTGWANGISATDVASATVVVGTPVVPPLINVTKVPSPLALSAAGGQVTYTEKITNPGTVALSNVTLRDDKCSPMRYISGDTNGDTKLDVAETWTYTCSTNLTATTTNTAVATGEANGLTVTDIAIATVVVATAVPALPNTGFAPYQGIITMIVLVGILAVMIGYYFVQKKQTS